MIEIMQYISIVAPGAASFLGIIFTVIYALCKLKKTIEEFKGNKDKLISELQASDNEYKQKVNELIAQNKELAKVNSILVDKITKIKGYCDVKNKEI